MIKRKNIKIVDRDIKISKKSMELLDTFLKDELDIFLRKICISKRNMYITKNDIENMLEKNGTYLII